MDAGAALAQVQTMLDDEGFVHAEAETALRFLNRAHQFVSLRWKLLRETRAIDLVPEVPLYRLTDVFPRFVSFLSADIEGQPVWPVGMEVIRYGDPEWLATEAGESPQWIYPMGLLWFGLYPVPSLEATLNMTATVVPEDLADVDAPLVVPDAYLPRVIETTTGFLMLSSERAPKQARQHVANGLGLTTKATD